MASLEIYNPEKSTGYVVDEYVNYDRSVYRCCVNTPKPAGPFNDEYWNLVGYVLDGSGLVNYSGDDTSVTFDDPSKFMMVEGNQTIEGVKTFTDVIEMTKPAASASQDSEKVVTIGWVNNSTLALNVVHKDAYNEMEVSPAFKIKNQNISIGENPSTNQSSAAIQLADQYGNLTGFLKNGKLTNGVQFIGLHAYRKVNDSDIYNTLDIGIKADGTKFVNIDGSQIATLGREQTFTAKQTFNNTVTVSKAFGAGDFDIIKGSDTNGKGDSRFLGYYTGNQIYTRISSYNKTSSKNMYLDVISKDDGNGVVTLGGGTTNLNMTTATAATNLAYVATMGWTNDPTKSTNVVHRTDNETIAGVKTFRDEIKGRFRTASCHRSIDYLTGNDNKTYNYNSTDSTNNYIKWTNSSTTYYTKTTTYPSVGGTIYSNSACTTAATTVKTVVTGGWYKIGSFTSSSSYNSHIVVFRLWSGLNGDQGSVTGKIMTRTGGNGTAGTFSYGYIEFDYLPAWLKLDRFKLLYKANQGSEGSKYCLIELWVNLPVMYTGYCMSIQDERAGGEAYDTSWTFYNQLGSDKAVVNLPSGYTQVDAIVANNAINSVKNQNTSGSPIYDWEGTLAQYNAQNIASTHPDWLCFITDDNTTTGFSAYSKTESDNLYLKKTDIDSKFATLLSSMYPKGSIYIGTQATCPMATLISGSTWVLVGKGCSLWGGNGTMYDSTTVGTTTNANYANAQANTTIAAGLPDHTHDIPLGKCDSNSHHAQGNCAPHPMSKDSYYTVEKTRSLDSSLASVSNYDRNNNSKIFGKSSTVQPPAYVVNVWRRTA